MKKKNEEGGRRKEEGGGTRKNTRRGGRRRRRTIISLPACVFGSNTTTLMLDLPCIPMLTVSNVQDKFISYPVFTTILLTVYVLYVYHYNCFKSIPIMPPVSPV